MRVYWLRHEQRQPLIRRTAVGGLDRDRHTIARIKTATRFDIFEALVMSKLLKLRDLVCQETHFQLDDRALSGSRLVLVLKDFDWRAQNVSA